MVAELAEVSEVLGVKWERASLNSKDVYISYGATKLTKSGDVLVATLLQLQKRMRPTHSTN